MRAVLLVPVVTLLVAGRGVAQAPRPDQLVWPAPPEIPRVRYVGTLTSEADLGRKESFFSRMKRSLSGSVRTGMLRVQRPFDIYADAGDRIYVTDGMSPGVFLFDRQAKQARILGEDVPGGLGRPTGLGGDGTGRVYVADPGSSRVVVFGPGGAYERAFGGRDELYNPVDVAVDPASGRFYVVDAYLHQVVVFDASGSVVQRIGKQVATAANRPRLGSPQDQHGQAEEPAARDTTLASDHVQAGAAAPTTRDLRVNRGGEPGEFRYPVAAAVGPDGTVYVSDQMNFRVQAFDRSGTFLRQVGKLGTTPGSFARPKGLAVDRGGHLYVADAAFSNIQVFSPEGELLLVFGSLGHGDGQHWMPLGLCVDRADRIYVADRYNNRAAIYQYLSEPERPSDASGDAAPLDR